MMITNKRLLIIVTTVALLLLIPLIAMQFTNEVNWNLADFIVAAILLLGTGFPIDFIIKRVKKAKYRIALSLAVVMMLLLIWAELAVGIFGTPLSGQ